MAARSATPRHPLATLAPEAAATAPCLVVAVTWGTLTDARDGRHLLSSIADRGHVTLHPPTGAAPGGFGRDGTGRALRNGARRLGGAIGHDGIAARVLAALARAALD